MLGRRTLARLGNGRLSKFSSTFKRKRVRFDTTVRLARPTRSIRSTAYTRNSHNYDVRTRSRKRETPRFRSVKLPTMHDGLTFFLVHTFTLFIIETLFHVSLLFFFFFEPISITFKNKIQRLKPSNQVVKYYNRRVTFSVLFIKKKKTFQRRCICLLLKRDVKTRANLLAKFDMKNLHTKRVHFYLSWPRQWKYKDAWNIPLRKWNIKTKWKSGVTNGVFVQVSVLRNTVNWPRHDNALIPIHLKWRCNSAKTRSMPGAVLTPTYLSFGAKGVNEETEYCFV